MDKSFYSCCVRDENIPTIDERFPNKKQLTQQQLPTYTNIRISAAEPNMAFSNVAKSLTVQLSTPHATDITDSSEHLDTSHFTSLSPAHHTINKLNYV